MGAAVFGLFCCVAAHIFDLYLDDGFILSDLKREDYKKEGLRSSIDIGRGDIGIDVIMRIVKEK